MPASKRDRWRHSRQPSPQPGAGFDVQAAVGLRHLCGSWHSRGVAQGSSPRARGWGSPLLRALGLQKKVSLLGLEGGAS